MNHTNDILHHAKTLFNNLSLIYLMIAKHPVQIQTILPQANLNLKCLEKLISTYPLAFSAHTEEFFLNLKKSHSTALKKPSFSLLSTLSRQSSMATDEIQPEKILPLELSKNVRYDFQISNILSNINTFIGFFHLAKKTNDLPALKTTKDLILKNFNLMDYLVGLCFTDTLIKKQFSPDTKEQVLKLYKLVMKVLNSEKITPEKLLELTQHIMTTINNIKKQKKTG